MSAHQGLCCRLYRRSILLAGDELNAAPAIGVEHGFGLQVQSDEIGRHLGVPSELRYDLGVLGEHANPPRAQPLGRPHAMQYGPVGDDHRWAGLAMRPTTRSVCPSLSRMTTPSAARPSPSAALA